MRQQCVLSRGIGKEWIHVKSVYSPPQSPIERPPQSPWKNRNSTLGAEIQPALSFDLGCHFRHGFCKELGWLHHSSITDPEGDGYTTAKTEWLRLLATPGISESVVASSGFQACCKISPMEFLRIKVNTFFKELKKILFEAEISKEIEITHLHNPKKYNASLKNSFISWLFGLQQTKQPFFDEVFIEQCPFFMFPWETVCCNESEFDYYK